MKKIFTILALAGLVLSANAQKAKINQAKNALILQKVDDAKKLIDEALENEKTKTLPATYLMAAEVYATVAQKSVSTDAFAKVKQFMATAEELDAKGDAKGKGIGKAQKDIKKTYSTLYTKTQEVGAAGFDSKNYTLAKEAFLFTCVCNEKTMDNYNMAADSLFLYNAGLAAWNAEEYEDAAVNFVKTFETGYEASKVILFANSCYKQLKDTVNMEKTLKMGFEKYPGEKDILLSLIQHYLDAKRNEEALIYLNEAIAKDSSNPMFFFARGCLNEKINKNDAIADYNKALELDPKHYSSLYNLAIIYYNMGLDLRNDASNERDDKKYAELMNQVHETMLKSKPYIERAVEAATTKEIKIEALSTMKTICYNVDPEDKDGKWMWAKQQLDELQ